MKKRVTWCPLTWVTWCHVSADCRFSFMVCRSILRSDNAVFFCRAICSTGGRIRSQPSLMSTQTRSSATSKRYFAATGETITSPCSFFLFDLFLTLHLHLGILFVLSMASVICHCLMSSPIKLLKSLLFSSFLLSSRLKCHQTPLSSPPTVSSQCALLQLAARWRQTGKQQDRRAWQELIRPASCRPPVVPPIDVSCFCARNSDRANSRLIRRIADVGKGFVL